MLPHLFKTLLFLVQKQSPCPHPSPRDPTFPTQLVILSHKSPHHRLQLGVCGTAQGDNTQVGDGGGAQRSIGYGVQNASAVSYATKIGQCKPTEWEPHHNCSRATVYIYLSYVGEIGRAFKTFGIDQAQPGELGSILRPSISSRS
jgi:hypothetical protein